MEAKFEKENMPVHTHEEVRKVVGEILSSGDEDLMEVVQERIKYIQDQLRERYVDMGVTVLEKSPYWHALSQSTPREDLLALPQDENQRDIARIIVEYFNEYIKSEKPSQSE